MSKYYYYAIEDKIGEKHNAYVYRVHQSMELLNALKKTLSYYDNDGKREIVDKHYATAAPNRKTAVEWASEWNRVHALNNRSYYNRRGDAPVYDVGLI